MEQPKKDPQKELEIQLNELEERVDRLRALYEQYFMGYEKLEPSIARKDVERRFTVLRKTQIRNTATRFRFNVITQKYNTYSMYWTRICRQIEEGTFKRHVAKAAKRFGQDPKKKKDADVSVDIDLVDIDIDDLDDPEALAAVLGEKTAPAPKKPQLQRPPTPTAEMELPLGARPPGRPTLERPATPTAEIPVPATPRVARSAALPPGAKQPLLVRRAAPAETRSPTPAAGEGKIARPSTPTFPMAAPVVPPAEPRAPAPSTPRVAPPSERAPLPAPASSTPRVAPSERAPTPSSPRIAPPAAAPPAASPTPAGAPNRVPGAPPSTRGPGAPGGYRPVALPPGSAGRIAVATPRPIAPPERPSSPNVAAPTSTPKIPQPPESQPARRPPPGLPSQIAKKP